MPPLMPSPHSEKDRKYTEALILDPSSVPFRTHTMESILGSDQELSELVIVDAVLP